MSDRHDDEITYYRARVGQIPERPEATPERAVMSDDSYPMRDSECFVHRIRVLRDRLRLAPATELHVACRDALDEIERLRTVIAEREAEVKRLTGWLEMIDIADDEYARYLSAQALAGEAVPE